MKKITFLFVSMGMIACTPFSRHSELKTDIDTMSYYFGMSRTEGIMNYLVMQAGVDTTYMEAFYKGFKNGMKHFAPEDVAYLEGMRIAHMINNQWIKNLNAELFMGDSSKTINSKAVFSGFYQGVKRPDNMAIMHAQTYSQMKIDAIREATKREKYATAIATNEQFLIDNKEKEGVKTTDSGLQYKIIVEGNGAIPQPQSSVKVNYRGRLVDGTEFDSSYKTGEPGRFRVNQVIKGWTEALAMMPVGSKWELYIPQELAYGNAERSNIPPYSTLIFEVELLEIETEK